MQFTADTVNFDVKSVLAVAKSEKAKVEITLKGGNQFAGKVAEVGAHAAVLTELMGREFYDAMILIDEIAAITTQVRNLGGKK